MAITRHVLTMMPRTGQGIVSIRALRRWGSADWRQGRPRVYDRGAHLQRGEDLGARGGALEAGVQQAREGPRLVLDGLHIVVLARRLLLFTP